MHSREAVLTWMYIIEFISVNIPELTIVGQIYPQNHFRICMFDLVLDDCAYLSICMQHLAESNLLQFSSLIELYEALGR